MSRTSPCRPRRLTRFLAALLLGAAVAGAQSAAPASAVTADRTLTYHGVRVSVPSGWPVVDLAADRSRCLLLTEPVVYLGNPGPDQACGTPRIGARQAIWVAVDQSGQGVLTGASVGDVATASDAKRAGLAASSTDSVPSASTQQVAPVPTSRFTGMGFDTCTAPSLTTMRAWRSSPYRVAGIYLGGVNRACGDGNLSASWVGSVIGDGWGLLPIYVGPQAPCVLMSGVVKMDPATASTQGRQAAADAVAQATRFGLGTGTTVFLDVENYAPNASCTSTVLSFVTAWTNELRRVGYRSGVYGNPPSLMTDLSNARTAGRTDVSYPDTVWYAHWNGRQTVYAEAQYPAFKDAYWPGARVHQYRGDFSETWNGVTQAMDANWVDATLPGKATPVSYGTNVTGPGGAGFVFTGDMAYWRPAGPAGLAGMAHTTGTTGATEYNGATWTGPATTSPQVVSAYVPAGVASGIAVYTVRHAAGTTTVRRDQSTTGWIDLGTYSGTTTTPISVHLGDNANAGTSERIVADAVRFVPQVQPPTAPGTPVATAGDSKATVSWSASTPRGSTITGYTVVASTGQSKTVSASTTTTALSGLTNGTPLTFTVRAESSAGATTAGPSNLVVPTPPDVSFPRDVTGDSRADVLAIVSGTGALRVYPSNGAGGWLANKVASAADWSRQRAVLTAGNWDADRVSDVLTVDTNGAMTLWPGRGDGTLSSPRVIGQGWLLADRIVPVGDFDGDGHPDLLARRASDGGLLLYRGNGYGGFISVGQVGWGWGVFDTILGAGDFNGDHTNDVLARGPDGTLWLYPGDGRGGWLASRKVGAGWDVFTGLVAPGDFTGDGRPDVLARTAAGALFVYPGNGLGGWQSRRQVGAGWQTFSLLLP